MTATAVTAKRSIPIEQAFIRNGVPVTEYIRKDVFDARMDRMESLLSQTVAEMRLDNLNLCRELEGRMSDLRDELKGDMSALQDKLEGEMSGLRNELKSDMSALQNKLEGEMSDLRDDMSALRGKLEGEMFALRDDMTGFRGEFNDAVREIRSDIRVINARLDTQQTKFGWYLAAFGAVITAATAAIQILMK